MARERVQEGVALYDEGKYEQAVAKYQEALAAVPGDSHAQSELAMTFNTLKRYPEAAALCQQVLEKPDADVAVYVTYGNSLDGMGKPREAEQAYQRGLRQYPDSYALYYNLGVAQTGRERLDEALSSFQHAVSCNPRHASSHLSIGAVELARQKRVPAIMALGQFLVLEPRSERAMRRVVALDKAMSRGVTQQDENNITISIDSRTLTDSKRKKTGPDNFSQTDFLLSLGRAVEMDSKNKAKTEAERFSSLFSSMCRHLAEVQGKGNHGFMWEFYVPYYIEMEKRGYVPAFTYLIHSSQMEAGDVQQWLAAHKTEVEVFQEWARSYTWPKVKM
ncbi:hypothetical protein GCM10023185_34820 [Hymenobacter saemangeumensis]|uniref:Tetratricopeptide repeat protein n=1 Tax=Hymenobacter saemangeumensis TaxID=1084522 RepID=A0ABP8IPT8_9BACT